MWNPVVWQQEIAVSWLVLETGNRMASDTAETLWSYSSNVVRFNHTLTVFWKWLITFCFLYMTKITKNDWPKISLATSLLFPWAPKFKLKFVSALQLVGAAYVVGMFAKGEIFQEVHWLKLPSRFFKTTLDLKRISKFLSSNHYDDTL